MCGIVGFTGHNLGRARLGRAVRSLHHRGPDGFGIYIDPVESAGLGHARLSIIDPENGAQPLFARDGELVLVCNGEIYEFERLRNELKKLGHEFYTKSDSEVILHLYSEYGMDFVHYLRGEFSFLLLDKCKRRMIAVNDRFGIKPLFFHEEDGNFVFASETKAIFATGCLLPKIDVVAVRDFLSGVIPDSLFEGIQVVSPGCFLNVDLETGEHEMQRYWDLDLPTEEKQQSDPGPGIEENATVVRTAVDRAVKLRLRADVPVGVYLSGGMDSSVVAASMARQHSEPIKAFTIAFSDDENFNELKTAERMAEKIGAELHSVSCDHQSMLDHAEDCLWVAELPFHNLHCIGKFLLSRLAREHVKVVLTGEGADETFLGYICFQPEKGAITDQMGNRLKSKKFLRRSHIRKILAAIGFVPLHEHAELFSALHQRVINHVFHAVWRSNLVESHPLTRLMRRLRPAQTVNRSTARKIQYFWIKSMLATYNLTIIGDRQEMAHSIEGRPPFLDHRLFERMRGIPDDQKIHNGIEKAVLREAFKEEITEEVYSNKKWPFSAPPLWLKKGVYRKLDRLLDRYLSKEAIAESGIFDYRMVRGLRFIERLLFFDSKLKRRLNELFTIVLTVQMLEQLYVQNFALNSESRQADNLPPIREMTPEDFGSTRTADEPVAV